MSKLFLASSLLVVSSTLALLPAACATRAADDEPVASGVQALAEDGGVAKGSIAISAVYAGGGASSTAKYKRDYVELVNRTKTPIDLTGLSLQYATATGAFPSGAVLPLTGTIAASSYFLVALAPTGAGGPPEPADLPTPDQNTTGVDTLQLAVADGKVALAPTTEPLNCGTSNNRCAAAKVLDLVGYGSVSDFEGNAGSVASFDETKAAARKGAGCTDANDNRADFEVVDAVARNAATTPKPDCTTAPPTRDAGPDGKAPAPGFGDPDLGDEPPFDAGAGPRDAGGGSNAGGGSDSGCSTTGSSDLASPIALAGLIALGLVLAKRRRP